MDQVTTAPAERPLWRRIVDFPLVAMLIGVVVIMLGFMAAGIIVKFLIPTTPGLGFEMNFDLVSVPILVALYVFVIAGWVSISATIYVIRNGCGISSWV